MQNKKKPSISVVVTAFNEEKNLPKLLKEIKKLKNKFKLEIVVVDDGSLDNTKKVAIANKADRVISYKPNKGKGAAFKIGSQKSKGDFIIQIDSDYQFMPYEIPKLVKPLLEGFDVALGTRYEKGSKRDEDSVHYSKFFGSILLSFITSAASQTKVTDVMAGFKGFRKEVFKYVTPTVNHFGYEAEITIKAAKKGFKIKNVPITYRKRSSGKSSVNSLKDGFLVLRTIITTALSS